MMYDFDNVWKSSKEALALLSDIDFVNKRIFEQEVHIRELRKRRDYKFNVRAKYTSEEFELMKERIESAQGRLEWFHALRNHLNTKTHPTKEDVLKSAEEDKLI